MMTPTLAHDLSTLSAAVTTLAAHCDRRHAGHTRRVLCALRAANDHAGATLPDDDARTVALYYRTRREYWRDYLTTDDAAANDDHDAAAAIARGCGGAHAPWAQED